jgi:KaiC/GvpD/RAD55 family RecA-like ATPase
MRDKRLRLHSIMATPKSLCQGRYAVKSLLGGVSHSRVYECYDPQLETRVAVKVLSVAEERPEIQREMFRREVGALDGFEHAHVVQMLRYEAEEHASRLNIVLELVPGGITLDKLISGGASLQIAASLRWRLEQLLGVLSAITAAHGRNIIHRDVKLANLLVDREAHVVKLADFGIARILENYGRGPTGETLRDFYSKPFAAPEQRLGADTSFPVDFYAFGVVLAAVLAWRIPEPGFDGSSCEDFLLEFRRAQAAPEVSSLADLINRLLSVDPSSRPRAPDIERALQRALDATLERVPLRVVLTTRAKQRGAEFGLPDRRVLDDLNDALRVAYEPGAKEQGWSISCVGHRGVGRLAPGADDESKLKMVDFYAPHQTELQRRRERSSAAPFLLIDGEGSGQALIDFVWEEHEKHRALVATREQREKALGLAAFILERQRERLSSVRVLYRLNAEPPEPTAPQAFSESWKQKLAEMRGEMHATTDQSKEAALTSYSDEIIQIYVDAVRIGLDSEIGDAQLDTDAIPREWEDALDPDMGFSIGRRMIGTAYGWNREKRILSIKLSREVSLPAQGEIGCEDVATKTALDRQENAIGLYVEDGAVNPRLARLIVSPEDNCLADLEPVELLRPLEPADDIQDIVSRALSARDFFLVQGPPGTGKTTLITEIMCQILKRDPTSRILLTSQANEAVENAIEALRAMRTQLGAPWLIVRDRSQRAATKSSELFGFEKAFAEWSAETLKRCAVELNGLTTQQTGDVDSSKRRDLVNALSVWRDKLTHLPDVKSDFAASVHVWGMTLLRVPAVLKRVRDVRFDYVIVDEAARANPAELLVALVMGKKFILVGDHRQLPPFLDQETIDDIRREGFDENVARHSIFEEFFTRVPESNRAALRRQFRMHRSIGEMIGALYYPEVGLETGVPDSERTLNLQRYGGRNRVFWLDVADGREAQHEESTSRVNFREVAEIERLLLEFDRELVANGSRYSCGVIAAYGDQRDELLSRILPKSKRWKALDIRIDSVDAFQGKQDDIIIYSNVRTHTAELKFVSDRRRLNVAFSRAKRLLVIVGHKETAALSPQLLRVIEWLPPENVITVGGKP